MNRLALVLQRETAYNVYDSKTAGRMGRGISGHSVVMCKVRRMGRYMGEKEGGGE